MAWNQTDLDKIDTALANNVRKVTFADGRTVEYQNADQMLAVRKAVKAELSAARTQIVRATRATMRRP
jgi:phage baseplate assembly protein gpV